MKRWIALAISAVLLLITGLVSMEKEISVGKGSGESARISTIEDFFDLTESILSFNPSDSESEEEEVAALASDTLDESEEDENEEGTETIGTRYSNFTFHETSSFVEDENIASIISRITFQQELTGYITKDAVFYHFEGVMTSLQSFGSELSVTESCLFNLDLYAGKETYVRFQELLIVANGTTIRIPDEWKGVWISCAGEDGDVILSTVERLNIVDSDKTVVGYVGQLENLYNEGDLKKQKTSYVISSDKLDIKGGSLEINLDNAKNPQMSLLASRVSDVVSFSDVNNTVVKLPKNFKAYEGSDLREFLEKEGI